MKTFITLLGLCFWNCSLFAGGTNFFSTYPNSSTLRGTDLFIVEHSDNTGTFNIQAGQMPGALGVQPTNANLTAWGALTPIGYTNGYPWGSLYDAAGLATAATNGYPWGSLYDAVNAAHNATNGYPWGSLYDAAGLATAATNAFHNGNGLTNLIHSSTVSGVSGVSVALSQNPDGSTNYGLTVTAGGSGTVTSVGLSAPGEFTVSGSPVTGAGTLSFTRTADANFLGLGGTNMGFLKVTNTVSIGGQATVNGLIVTNGTTNLSLTASTLLEADANKKIASIANGVGVLTNDANGNFGFAPLLGTSTLQSNTVTWTDGQTNLVSTNRTWSITIQGANNTLWVTNLLTGKALLLGTNGVLTGDATGLTNYADTNIVVSTNNWNWPGPTNNLDWARGTLQRYQPTSTAPLAITNFLNFPVGQAASVVFWVANTNTSALNVLLPSPCETTNSLGGLTVSVNASNRLQILFQWSPLSTNALFSAQQLIK